jgi:hypothetical protein
MSIKKMHKIKIISLFLLARLFFLVAARKTGKNEGGEKSQKTTILP